MIRLTGSFQLKLRWKFDGLFMESILLNPGHSKYLGNLLKYDNTQPRPWREGHLT